MCGKQADWWTSNDSCVACGWFKSVTSKPKRDHKVSYLLIQNTWRCWGEKGSCTWVSEYDPRLQCKRTSASVNGLLHSKHHQRIFGGDNIFSTPANDHLFQVRRHCFSSYSCTNTICECMGMMQHTDPSCFSDNLGKRPWWNDWGKLKWVLKYLNRTQFSKLTLQPLTLDIVKWYVNASYAIHDNCQGHTGGGHNHGERGYY